MLPKWSDSLIELNQQNDFGRLLLNQYVSIFQLNTKAIRAKNLRRFATKMVPHFRIKKQNIWGKMLPNQYIIICVLNARAITGKHFGHFATKIVPHYTQMFLQIH